MSAKKYISIFSALLSGLLAFIISLSFATGFIAENYFSETKIIAPEYFIILVIWGIGAIFVILHLIKDSWYFFIPATIITWTAIPVGMRIISYLALKRLYL